MTAAKKRVLSAFSVSGIVTGFLFWYFVDTPLDPLWLPLSVWLFVGASLERTLVKMAAEDNLANLYEK